MTKKITVDKKTNSLKFIKCINDAFQTIDIKYQKEFHFITRKTKSSALPHQAINRCKTKLLAYLTI